jgi:hypothetical protein
MKKRANGSAPLSPVKKRANPQEGALDEADVVTLAKAKKQRLEQP